jgi:predicted outer membrane protein
MLDGPWPLRAALCIALPMAVTGCHDADRGSLPPTAQQAVSLAGDDAGAAGDVDGGATQTASGEVALSDAEIAGVLSAVIAAEGNLGALALVKADSLDVAVYGGELEIEYLSATTTLKQLLATTGLALVESAVSRGLTAAATAVLESLRPLAAPAFDHPYLLAQIAQHEQMLSILSAGPPPNNAELGTYLQTFRLKLAAQLQAARVLLVPLASQ